MLRIRESVDGTEGEERSQRGDTPTEKEERCGGRAARDQAPHHHRNDRSRQSVNHWLCNQGPKGAWNPKPWALKSREQASGSRVSGGPVITSPDKVPDCPPLCNQWDSILETLQSQLSLPHAPVTLSHHQDIRSLITCSLLDSCPLCSLCFLFLDLTLHCPHPDPSRVPADTI